MRVMSIIAALALVVGGVVLARQAAEPATPKNGVVVDQSPQIGNLGDAIGQSLGVGAGVQAQINIQAIVCPILNALGAAFGAFIAPVIAALKFAFGCAST